MEIKVVGPQVIDVKSGLVILLISDNKIEISRHWLKQSGFRGRVVVSEGMFGEKSRTIATIKR